MGKVEIKHPTSRFFFPWPVVLVSCIDEDGKPNIITIGASSICSSNPPTVGVAIGTAQYSLGLIKRTKDFGVNLPTEELLWQTDFCGSQSGRNMNKFEAAGLTVQPARLIQSPLIAECPVSMECKLLHAISLGNHEWLIGEIVAVHCDEEILDQRGELDTSKVHPIFSHWAEYWSVGQRLQDWHFSRTEPKP